jgi:hypothetical protein
MTTRPPRLRARNVGRGRGHVTPRRRAQLGMCVAATALTFVSIAMAPAAVADSTDSLRAAVAAARGTAACGPLRSDPVVDQAAMEINETTDRWINNASRAVPETDPLSPLKDLGYGGSKATVLSGAAKDPGDAIRATLLQGFAKLPDCSYTEFGVNALYNAKKDMILTTVVLAA